jgi:hypothetical protein
MRLAGQRIVDDIARERADHGAVARRLGVEIIGRRDARRLRHVLHDDGRLAQNVFGQVFGQEPRAEIVVVAGRKAGNQPNVLALIKIRGAGG